MWSMSRVIDSFFLKAKRWQITDDAYDFAVLLDSADKQLFNASKCNTHCLRVKTYVQ